MALQHEGPSANLFELPPAAPHTASIARWLEFRGAHNDMSLLESVARSRVAVNIFRRAYLIPFTHSHVMVHT